jgi:hypothetical protein
MSTDRAHIAKRKFRKLLRNPVGFVRDSPFFRSFSPPAQLIAQDAMALHEPERLQNETIRRAITPRRPAINGLLRAEGKIQISEAKARLKGWTVALLYEEAQEEDADRLIEAFSLYEDFSPLKAEKIGRFSCQINRYEPVISILNRIDTANKGRLGGFDIIICLNVHANVVEAVRCCSPSIKTILIRSDDTAEGLNVSTEHTDALICSADFAERYTGEMRRVNTTSSIVNQAQLVRKVVQELGPKSPDVLLPLIGAEDYDPTLIDFDSSRFQGVIYLNHHPKIAASSLRDYLAAMSQNVSAMLVLDSVYMRYRTLCEDIELGSSPAKLIEFCLMDGVLFDVH